MDTLLLLAGFFFNLFFIFCSRGSSRCLLCRRQTLQAVRRIIQNDLCHGNTHLPKQWCCCSDVSLILPHSSLPGCGLPSASVLTTTPPVSVTLQGCCWHCRGDGLELLRAHCALLLLLASWTVWVTVQEVKECFDAWTSAEAGLFCLISFFLLLWTENSTWQISLGGIATLVYYEVKLHL